PLEEPLLHEREATDLLEVRHRRDVLDHPGAIDEEPLLLEERRRGVLVEGVPCRDGAADGVARLVHREPLEGAAELVERRLAGVHAAARSDDRLGLAPEEAHELGEVGDHELDVDDVPLDLLRDELDRRADDDELPAGEAELVQVAEPPADIGFLQRLVEVPQHEDRGLRVRRDEVEDGARAEDVAGRALPVAAQALGEGPDPERRRRSEQRRGGLAQERGDALLLRGADVRERTPRLDDLAEDAERATVLRLAHPEIVLVGLPAAFQPFSPSAITLTLVYPASTARRAAPCEACQCESAQ